MKVKIQNKTFAERLLLVSFLYFSTFGLSLNGLETYSISNKSITEQIYKWSRSNVAVATENNYRINPNPTNVFIVVDFLSTNNNMINICMLKNGNYSLKTMDSLNHTDNNGKKQGKWIYYGKDRPEEGYPINGKIEEGSFKNSRKEGIWLRYHNDGVTPKLKGNYVNNIPKGSYVKYFPNGKVQEKGYYECNQNRDSLVRFYENGIIEYKAYFNDYGKEQGTVNYYYANGQLELKYSAKDGSPFGEAIRYYENGDIKEVIKFGSDGQVLSTESKAMKNPSIKVIRLGVSKIAAPKVTNFRTKGVVFLPNGYNKVYNANEEIWQDGLFKNSILWDGKVYEYDKDGILLNVKIYKNGVYHSYGQL